jgi:hypothetical protein
VNLKATAIELMKTRDHFDLRDVIEVAFTEAARKSLTENK